MKKIVISLMAALAAIPVFFSCMEKEQEVQVVEVKPAVPFEYEYHFEIADGDTRASLMGEDGVYWENGDQVGLFAGPVNSTPANVNVSAESAPTVVLSTSNPLAAGTDVYAYYPYQEGNVNPEAAKVVLPRIQQGGSVSAMPMAGLPFQVQQGEGNDGVIRFVNLGSVIDFRVYSTSHTAERIQSIRVSVFDGTNPISGEATLNLTGVKRDDDASMALSWSNGAVGSSVSLLQTASIAASKESATEPLYMIVAPGTYYSGSIEVFTDAASYTFSFTNLEFGRNILRRFNMNLDGSKVVRRTVDDWYEKIASADQLTDGDEYLIVYESGSKMFKPILKGTSTLDNTENNVLGVTIEGNRILATEEVDACRVVIESAGSGQYYMKAVAVGNYYFYPTSSSIGATRTANTDAMVSVSFVSGTNGTVNITAGSNRYFKYSTYSSCFKQSSSSSSLELALYKRVNNDGFKTQSLQFDPRFVRISLDGHTTPFILADAPVLSGLKTQVAFWQSSNPDVAVVDASGTVQVMGGGSTVITAFAEPDDMYASGSASFTLVVLGDDVFSIENDKVAAYLDLVYNAPYNPPADYTFTHMTAELQAGNTDQTNRLDWPKPVPIQWTTSASGNPSVIVYDESGQVENMANVTVTSATSADIYSLIPGRTYTYVVKDGNTLLGEGSFRTTGRRRMIKVGDSPYGQAYANNCRDFGGQVTADGRRIKYGKMFRGSNMDKITDKQKTYLKDYMHIGLDVDLRSSGSDAGQGDNVLFDALGLEEQGGHTTLTFNSWDDFSKTFDGKYKMTEILKKVFQSVAANEGVYVHCMVGADRTGYVCMLLEAILGIPQGWCDVDYELTSFSGAVNSGIGRWRVGTYSSGGKTLSNNWYYRKTNSKLQGVDYIYSLDGGSYGNSFQAKAVNYVVEKLEIDESLVIAFQNNMLEENN